MVQNIKNYETIDSSVLDEKAVSQFCNIYATAMLGFYERFGNTGGFIPIRTYEKRNGSLLKGLEIAVRNTISKEKIKAIKE